jgi:hypothetical protein
MDREQGGHTCAPTDRPGQFHQNQQKQQAVADVQQEAGDVMCPSVHAKPLDIEHVADPGQRSAGRRIRVGEGPGDVVDVEAGGDVRILYDELEVVVVDELELAGRKEDGAGEQCDADGRRDQRRGVVRDTVLFSAQPSALTRQP